LCTNETTTLGWRGKLRNIYWNLSGADTDSETVDDAAHDEHGDVLRSGHNDTSNDPDDGANHDRLLATEEIGNVPGAESSEPGATSHCGSDTTLNFGLGTGTWRIALREVAFVGICTDNGAHRRDVETKEATTDNSDGRDEVILTRVSAIA
jgi:hypothetical protein